MCEIANKIKARRLELDLTLEDVAKAVGVGRSTVQRWESGLIKNMGRDKIAKLASVLQINPVELVPFDAATARIVELTTDINDKLRKYNAMAGAQMAIGQFVSQEDEDRLEALHQNPKLRLLFDIQKGMSDSDLSAVLGVVNAIARERGDDD